MKKYIQLCRMPHYIKNFLIFLPLVFSEKLFSIDLLYIFYGFLAFCMISSVVYIINDIKDVEKDKKHPTKCNRPIAKGTIKLKEAKIIAILLFVISMIFNYLAVGFNLYVNSLLILYLIINIGYSFGLKNVALIDIVLLTTGFVLRVYYGASVINVDVSNWLYLTIMCAAFFLSFGKRRNELTKVKTETRSVLKIYNKEFLDKNMYMCLTLTIVFYSLWSIASDVQYMVFSIPVVMLILMKYTMIIEGDSFGDPTEVLFKDKILQGLVIIYGILILTLMQK